MMKKKVTRISVLISNETKDLLEAAPMVSMWIRGETQGFRRIFVQMVQIINTIQ